MKQRRDNLTKEEILALVKKVPGDVTKENYLFLPWVKQITAAGMDPIKTPNRNYVTNKSNNPELHKHWKKISQE